MRIANGSHRISGTPVPLKDTSKTGLSPVKIGKLQPDGSIKWTDEIADTSTWESQKRDWRGRYNWGHCLKGDKKVPVKKECPVSPAELRQIYDELGSVNQVCKRFKVGHRAAKQWLNDIGVVTPTLGEARKQKSKEIVASDIANKPAVISDISQDEPAVILDQRLKNDAGKPRLALVPPGIIEAVGCIRTYGVAKYKDKGNWQQVEPERYRDAMMRHIVAYLRDTDGVDAESGLPHLWHAACNIAFLIELELASKPTE